MKTRKTCDILLENSVSPHVEGPDTLLPTEAVAQLIPPPTAVVTAEEQREANVLLPDTCINVEEQQQNRDSKTSKYVEPATPPGTSPLLKRANPVWYRNWTNAGISLCILYNLCIVMLLVMGYFKFSKS